MRIGHGYDAHRLAPGRPLVLGGVTIPYERGLAGHSDGDAVIHAVCDALLGAAALGDIGMHFPDTRQDLACIDSRLLLRRVVVLLREQGYAIANVDASIVAQRPKLSPYFPTMRARLAEDMAIDLRCVNIKATSTEGMGYTGREEGIAAHAVALIVTIPHAEAGAT